MQHSQKRIDLKQNNVTAREQDSLQIKESIVGFEENLNQYKQEIEKMKTNLEQRQKRIKVLKLENSDRRNQARELAKIKNQRYVKIAICLLAVFVHVQRHMQILFTYIGQYWRESVMAKETNSMNGIISMTNT